MRSDVILKTHLPFGRQARQRGVALLVGLILLLVMSIIGLTAIRGTTQQEKMAASNMQQTVTFQAGEAGLRLVMATIRDEPGVPPVTGGGMTLLTSALNRGVGATTNLPSVSPQFPDESGISAQATIAYTGTTTAVEGFDLDRFSAYGFEIDSNAQQQGTGAASQQTQGVVAVGPKDFLEERQ